MRPTALALVLALAAPAAADTPLTLKDGTRFTPAVLQDPALRKPEGDAAWVTVTGFEYRAAPGPGAPPRDDVLAADRTSTFMHRGFVWQRVIVDMATYLLLAEVDGDNNVIKPYGWVPLDLVIEKGQPWALPVRVKDPDTGAEVPSRIPRKGMIVNSQATVEEWLKARAGEPIFTVLAADYPSALDRETCPDGLLAEFTQRLSVGIPTRVVRRPDAQGWVVTFEEKVVIKGETTAAVQQYEVTRGSGNTLAVRDSPHMAWVYARPVTPDEFRTGADRQLRRKSFSVSNVFFIFRERDGFALIGSLDEVQAGNYVQLVHGWVESRRLSPWNTAATLEWDRPSTDPAAAPRRAPDGALFLDREAAMQWMAAKDRAARGTDPAAESAADGIRTNSPTVPETKDPKDPARSRHLSGMEMRYPVLDTAGQAANGYQLYQLGWFGPIRYQGRTDSVPDYEYQRERDKLMRSAQEMKTVEVLFVIDGTGSMLDQRRTVVPAVMTECLRRLDAIRKESGTKEAGGTFAGLRVRVTVVLFGQEADGEPECDHSALSNGQDGLANPAEIVSADVGGQVDARIKGLTDWVVQRGVLPAGRDPQEPVFGAVLKGIELAKFNPSATKYVFLMADMGDRVKHDRIVGESARVVRSLRGVGVDQNNQPVRDPQPKHFIGIQLPPVGGVNDPLLTDQFRAVKQALEANKEEAVEAHVEVSAGRTKAELAAGIRGVLTTRFDSLVQRIKRLEGQTINVISGIVQTDGVDPANLRHWRANEADLKILGARGVQVYQPVYGFAKVPVVGPDRRVRGQSQLRTAYLVKEADAIDIRDAIKKVVGESGELSRNPLEVKEQLEEVLIKLAKADRRRSGAGWVGDEAGLTPEERRKREQAAVSRMSLKKHFELASGIRFNSPLMSIEPGSLDAGPGKGPLTLDRKDMERVLLAAHRLNELIRDGTEGEYEITEDKPQGGGVLLRAEKKGPRRPADRVYVFPGDTSKWVWLDGELHLP